MEYALGILIIYAVGKKIKEINAARPPTVKKGVHAPDAIRDDLKDSFREYDADRPQLYKMVPKGDYEVNWLQGADPEKEHEHFQPTNWYNGPVPRPVITPHGYSIS